ncbi:MAG TPA: hypothetical protein VNN07_19085 [Candidatus Tectomicrobia bacterium]|nr:hypothetical protein [Candidatus Tectomicrobia bacterium]
MRTTAATRTAATRQRIGRAGVVVAALAALVAGPGSVRADQVSLDQVPPAVRATIEREIQGGRLEEIERETRGGEVVYEVAFERDGRSREIRVAEDGTVLERDD